MGYSQQILRQEVILAHGSGASSPCSLGSVALWDGRASHGGVVEKTAHFMEIRERSGWSPTAPLEDMSRAPKDLPWALILKVSRTPQALSLGVQLKTHP